MKAYLSGHATRPDGSTDSHWTKEVECKEVLLGWQKRGLRYTQTGYGKRIPTTYMVQHFGRWHRVFCCIFSNSGTLYIETKDGDIMVHNIEKDGV